MHRFLLRMPDHVWEGVQKQSQLTGRSANAEIVAWLQTLTVGPGAKPAGKAGNTKKGVR